MHSALVEFCPKVNIQYTVAITIIIIQYSILLLLFSIQGGKKRYLLKQVRNHSKETCSQYAQVHKPIYIHVICVGWYVLKGQQRSLIQVRAKCTGWASQASFLKKVNLGAQMASQGEKQSEEPGLFFFSVRKSFGKMIKYTFGNLEK